jgi:hypothetical protein
MTALRYTVAALALVLFLHVSSFNGWVAWSRYVARRPSPSWIPFVGGVCGVVACLAAPVAPVRWLWWAPLLLDWGSVPGTAFAVFVLWWHRWRINRGRD